MSSFSGGGFFNHSHSSGHRRGGYNSHSYSSGYGKLGGFLGSSHSSGRSGRYIQGGHYRPATRPSGCLGVFILGAALVGSLSGLVTLLG